MWFKLNNIIPYHLIYEKIGGESFFKQLVDTFYSKIEKDDILRPLFPDDLTDEIEIDLLKYRM